MLAINRKTHSPQQANTINKWNERTRNSWGEREGTKTRSERAEKKKSREEIFLIWNASECKFVWSKRKISNLSDCQQFCMTPAVPFRSIVSLLLFFSSCVITQKKKLWLARCDSNRSECVCIYSSTCPMFILNVSWKSASLLVEPTGWLTNLISF